MQRIEQYPIASKLVGLSVATELLNDKPKTLKVKLEAKEELLPSAKQYVENQGMLHEILSIAGLDETTPVSAITEVNYVIVSGSHLYELSLSISTS